MSRLQLALNVSDLETGIAFYSRLFDTEPAKVRDGYANFEVADPPLKLVLFEQSGAPSKLNHLGIEVTDAASVTAAAQRLARTGLEPTEVAEQTCCYAHQDKTYVSDPDGEPWEIYVVHGDSATFGASAPVTEVPVAVGSTDGGGCGDSGCCG